MRKARTARPRRIIGTILATCALGTGMLTGCASPSGPATASTSPTASPAASPTVAASTPVPDLSTELGYFRSGGIAGFADVLTVATDGTAVVRRRGDTVAQCRVKPTPLGHLSDLAATATPSLPSLRRKGPTKVPPAMPDAMTTGLVVGGARYPIGTLESVPDDVRSLYRTMGDLFSQTLTFAGPGTHAATEWCEPI